MQPVTTRAKERDDARFVESCHQHLSQEEIFPLESGDTDRWCTPAQTPPALRRHHYVHLPGSVFFGCCGTVALFVCRIGAPKAGCGSNLS